MPSRIPTPDDYCGAYGPDRRHGILSEHVYVADALGLVADRHPLPDGGTRIVFTTGEHALELCSELVELVTEDGPTIGRCGQPATDGPFCPPHAAIAATWGDPPGPWWTD
jgi:hypothetical protein